LKRKSTYLNLTNTSLRLAGRIIEIWRYPVSSVGGERLSRVNVCPDGVEGDRQYGLIDAATGAPAIPEKDTRWRKALHLEAAHKDSEFPVISFPDGRRCSLNDRSLNEVLTDYFGFGTAVAAYDHTERRYGFPLTHFRHRHFPLHLLTTASLEHLAALGRAGTIDSRRFRPTVLIEVNKESGFVESGWVGRRLRLGSLELMAQEDTKRCGVTFISQPGIEENPEILRDILRNNKRHLGIYCSIDLGGQIELGDEVCVEI
jgi:MOSC domain-containing protein